MILHRRLVVDNGNGAPGARAEFVLRGRVGQATWAQNTNIHCSPIRDTPYLVQTAIEIAVQRTHQTVGRDARRAAGFVDIAGTDVLGDGVRVGVRIRVPIPVDVRVCICICIYICIYIYICICIGVRIRIGICIAVPTILVAGPARKRMDE
jgi:hypothetical protein